MPTGLWTDYKASSFNGGNGTSTNPYRECVIISVN